LPNKAEENIRYSMDKKGTRPKGFM